MWTKQHHDIKRYGLPTTLHCINTDHDYWSINKDHKETSFYLDCVFTLDSVNIQSELCDRAIYPNLVVFLNPEKKKEVFVCFMHVFSMRGEVIPILTLCRWLWGILSTSPNVPSILVLVKIYLRYQTNWRAEEVCALHTNRQTAYLSNRIFFLAMASWKRLSPSCRWKKDLTSSVCLAVCLSVCLSSSGKSHFIQKVLHGAFQDIALIMK